MEMVNDILAWILTAMPIVFLGICLLIAGNVVIGKIREDIAEWRKRREDPGTRTKKDKLLDRLSVLIVAGIFVIGSLWVILADVFQDRPLSILEWVVFGISVMVAMFAGFVL